MNTPQKILTATAVAVATITAGVLATTVITEWQSHQPREVIPGVMSNESAASIAQRCVSGDLRDRYVALDDGEQPRHEVIRVCESVGVPLQ